MEKIQSNLYSYLPFFLGLFIYLNLKELQRKKERNLPSTGVLTKARGPGLPLLSSQAISKRAGLEVEQMGLKPVSLLDAGAAGKSLACRGASLPLTEKSK